MNFSKLKLNEMALGGGALGTASKASTSAAMSGKKQKDPVRKNMQSSMSTSIMGNKTRDPSVSLQKTTSEEHLTQLRQELEEVKNYESMKSDWRNELSEALVDGQERADHPYVTVMPTGDENLIQAIKQMRGEVQDKKKGDKESPKIEETYETKKNYNAPKIPAKKKAADKIASFSLERPNPMKEEVVSEEESDSRKDRQLENGGHASRSDYKKALSNKPNTWGKKPSKDLKAVDVITAAKKKLNIKEGKKKDCKDGYKWDSDEGKCVKKKSNTNIIIGRGWGHGHHDDEDKEDNNGDGGGGDMGGGDAGGGVGEMFDYLGDQLLNEIYPGAKD